MCSGYERMAIYVSTPADATTTAVTDSCVKQCPQPCNEYVYDTAVTTISPWPQYTEMAPYLNCVFSKPCHQRIARMIETDYNTVRTRGVTANSFSDKKA